MNEIRSKRKLSAILSADIHGYSRLMGEDDVGTIRRLKEYRALLAEFIQQFRGRVVDSPGDNLLAEFASIIDATECAVKIQAALKVKNAELPINRRMEFRIGINLGDVVEDEGQIYGDGVNIAARMEGLAKPGGICISGAVYDHIKNKMPLAYDYLGEKFIKNIADPLRVYQIKIDAKTDPPRQNREILSPVKPSIAVLPFINMSGDPEQEYFSDGITEDLITDLSKIKGLFVIARNTVFTYKGQAVNIAEIGQQLGVSFVLEGSVRKVDKRVRITAQLVDVKTGGHIWAERYDRDLENIFALQDEVTQKIVSTLAVKLTEDEQMCLSCKCKETCNFEAYDYYLKGLENHSRITPEDNLKARKMFKKSAEVDPQYAPAIAKLGETYLNDWVYGWQDDPNLVQEAFKLAQRAVALDDSLSDGHALLGGVHLWKKEYQKAISESEKAISLEPNNADWLADQGDILSWDGKPEKTIGLITKAMRLNPKYPASYLWTNGHAHFLLKQYEEAISSFKRALNLNPNYYPSHFYLAASYSESGQREEAQVQIAELLRKWPEGSAEAARQRLPYKDTAVLTRVMNAVNQAGLG